MMLFSSSLLLLAGSAAAVITGADITEADTLWPSQWFHTSQNATLRVLVQGNPSGSAFTILPSLKRDSGVDFDNLTNTLAGAGYFVLRPQLRNVLGSVGLDGDNVTSDSLNQDIVDVIDHFSADGKTFLLGHAAGAATAQSISIAHPEKVSGLIYAAKASANAPANVSALATTAANTSLPDSTRLIALQKGFFAPGHDASTWLEGFWSDQPLGSRSSSSNSTSSKVPESVPMLEVIAKKDPFRPSSSYNEYIDAQYSGQIEQVFIENASHALFPEQPGEVSEAILEWIRKQG